MLGKNDGFIIVESIISISIIGIIMYVISTSLYNSYSLMNLNKTKFEMLEIARKNIEYAKIDLQSGNEYTNKESYTDGYKVTTKVDKDENYYSCYKVEVDVLKDKIKVGLESYVTK